MFAPSEYFLETLSRVPNDKSLAFSDLVIEFYWLNFLVQKIREIQSKTIKKFDPVFVALLDFHFLFH